MKTALITGASRGIGRAIALCLAQNNYTIVLNYKEQDEAAAETERKIRSLGATCLKIKCDIRNISEVQTMYATIKKTFGYTDIVINNAGVARGGLLQDTAEEDFDYIIGTNLKGVYNVSKIFVPDMITNKWGRFVNISSVWGQVGAANESIYSASKAGVIGFTKSLAKELASSGITVNCIAPGAIMTDMLKQLPKSTLDFLENEIPVGRIGCGEDIAAMVATFVDEKSDYITGQVINISGGFTIS